VPARIEQGQALTGFRKNLPRSACGIFPESLAQSGTATVMQARNKISAHEPVNV